MSGVTTNDASGTFTVILKMFCFSGVVEEKSFHSSISAAEEASCPQPFVKFAHPPCTSVCVRACVVSLLALLTLCGSWIAGIPSLTSHRSIMQYLQLAAVQLRHKLQACKSRRPQRGCCCDGSFIGAGQHLLIKRTAEDDSKGLFPSLRRLQLSLNATVHRGPPRRHSGKVNR